MLDAVQINPRSLLETPARPDAQIAHLRLGR